MATRFDGLVCIDRTRRYYGYLIWRQDDVEPLLLESSVWLWPATDQGRFDAREQMVRAISRLQAESAQPAMRAYAP